MMSLQTAGTALFRPRTQLLSSMLRVSSQSNRSISLLGNVPAANLERQADLDHAVKMVRAYDPAGYLPGRLLPSSEMQTGYYAVRAFWVQTGFRKSTTTPLPTTSSPQEQLEWWQEGINDMYKDNSSSEAWKHPTFRLLRDLQQKHDLSKIHFDDVILGRTRDIDLKQYPTMDSLVEHAALSCGSLLQLVLQCGDISSPIAFEAARSVGVGHGLTNALRTSIPVISTTGKLIVPHDLCVKYGVRSPRYLLSALGQGDAECRAAFHNCIREIVEVAREQLAAARTHRDELLSDSPEAVSVMLPGLASEGFLNRLEQSGYDLTDKNLRNVGFFEHAGCAYRMVAAYYQQTY